MSTNSTLLFFTKEDLISSVVDPNRTITIGLPQLERQEEDLQCSHGGAGVVLGVVPREGVCGEGEAQGA